MTSSLTRISNPPNPYDRSTVDWLGEPPEVALEVFEEKAKSILARNDSPDIPFRWSINPYRGCFHGCAYCYARPTHHYLSFGAGTDFERKIVVKVNAPTLLKAAFDKPSWAGELVMFSGDTDCYQPLEASYKITRALLEICLEYRNPVGLITKGVLIMRDMELLKELSKATSLTVTISLAFINDQKSRLIEPYTPAPSARLRALEALSKAGIRTMIGIAPVIPGINDVEIPAILKSARQAGATDAFMTLLRLPGAVESVFLERLREKFPDRAARVENTIRRMRSGRLNSSTFGERMEGKGAEWEAIQWLFDSNYRDLGFGKDYPETSRPTISTFRRPSRQLELMFAPDDVTV